MVNFVSHPPREQAPLPGEPYDRWIVPGEGVKAEFHRWGHGYLMRFEGDADFEIYPDEPRVVGWPTPEEDPAHYQSLFHNAILPLIGDHNGGLFLHGSAVAIGGRAVAFIGQSGDGKTTLAGALAKAGHPFLTEDVIELVASSGGYTLQPKPSGLRLFADSAHYLLGDAIEWPENASKLDVSSDATIPFRDQPAPLAAIVILGHDHAAELSITPIQTSAAVQLLLPHSFILDVEDKPRLKTHFGRIVGLSLDVRCYQLDYTRDYEKLPQVITAITAAVQEGLT